MTPDDDIALLMTTVATVQDAERIARILVEERLAACVSRTPGVQSLYRWQDAVESTEEILVLVKTTAGRLQEARGRLAAIHSYELPEILVCEHVASSPAYAAWVRASVSRGAATG